MASNVSFQSPYKKYTIYVHLVPNGKAYVGKTSMKPEYRWWNGKGYEYNEAFYSDILKYGWDNIDHIVLAEVHGKEKAQEEEKRFVGIFRSYNSLYGYNKTTGGDSNFCNRHETHMKQSKARRKFLERPDAHAIMSEAQKRARSSQEYREKASKRMKDFYANETEEHKAYRLSRCHRNPPKPPKEKKPIVRSEEFKRHLSELKSVPVVCIETGEVFKNFQAAADFAGVHKACISDVLHGRQKQTGGYHWKYAEEKRNNGKF